MKTKTIRVRPQTEWYNADLEKQKRKKRLLERKYRQTLLTEDAQKQKALFGVFNKLLHRKEEQQLPAYNDLSELTNRFADYFTTKIERIRLDIQSMKCDNSASYLESNTCTDAVMSEFKLVTDEYVETLIKKSPSKSCSLILSHLVP
jgi:hypothetical protein